MSSQLKAVPDFLLHQVKSGLTSEAVCASTRKMGDWAGEKAKYLNMPINEKRRLYRCGNDYKTLDMIEPWSKYFTRQKDRLTQYGTPEEKFPKDPKLNGKVSLWTGDITQLEIDAIVNAANSTLRGGGGVDGVIHRAAGPLLKEECITLKGCATGEAKITGGYKLPAKYVIHTVGPQGEKPVLLQNCYNNSLSVLVSVKLRTVAFPCISTGLYGYPIEPAAHVALGTVRKFLSQCPDDIDRVVFCVFLQEDVKVYETLMQAYFPE